MDPCGMAFDFSRRSYRQWAEFGEERGQAAGWIRWYPCAPDAKVFPGQHAFLMTVWDTDEAPWWDDWGVGPGVYTLPKEGRSNRYPALPGTHYHGTRQWFTTGIPADVLSGEVPPPPPDPECPPVTLTVRDVTGPTQVNATYDEVGVIDCDRDRGQAVEQVEQGRVRLFDLFGGVARIPIVTVSGGSGSPTQLQPTDSGSLITCPNTGGSFHAQLPPAAQMAAGSYFWFHIPRQQLPSPVSSLTIHPFPGEVMSGAEGLFFPTLSGATPSTVLVVATQVGVGTTTWLQAGVWTLGLTPITLGVTPLSGGVEGELLRVGAGGVIEETPTVGGFNYV